jgi:RimJ/RimL family protein N-acetyltransferase
VDPVNVASTAVVQKMGARKGDVLKNVWRTRGDDGQEQERDRVLWYMDRPAVEG